MEMSKTLYRMSLETAMHELTLPELVSIFGGSHPAFLAAIVQARARLKK